MSLSAGVPFSPSYSVLLLKFMVDCLGVNFFEKFEFFNQALFRQDSSPSPNMERTFIKQLGN